MILYFIFKKTTSCTEWWKAAERQGRLMQEECNQKRESLNSGLEESVYRQRNVVCS